VVASHHPAYSEGDIVLAHIGWRTHAVAYAGFRAITFPERRD
jgi:NADPH-dependent curcumin reductase CurA